MKYLGTAGRDNFFNDLYLLDTQALLWTKLEVSNGSGSGKIDSPIPRCSHSACLVNSQMVVFGGLSSSTHVEPLSDLWVLELGISIPWQEEFEEELSVDTKELGGKNNQDLDEEGEVTQAEVWAAGQAEDEHKWVRRRVKVDLESRELSFIDCKATSSLPVGMFFFDIIYIYNLMRYIICICIMLCWVVKINQ